MLVYWYRPILGKIRTWHSIRKKVEGSKDIGFQIKRVFVNELENIYLFIYFVIRNIIKLVCVGQSILK